MHDHENGHHNTNLVPENGNAARIVACDENGQNIASAQNQANNISTHNANPDNTSSAPLNISENNNHNNNVEKKPTDELKRVGCYHLKDKQTGHIYLRAENFEWTGDSCILMGFESCASGKKNAFGGKHDTSGAAGKVSAVGGFKWSRLRELLWECNLQKKIPCPGDYGALRVVVKDLQRTAAEIKRIESYPSDQVPELICQLLNFVPSATSTSKEDKKKKEADMQNKMTTNAGLLSVNTAAMGNMGTSSNMLGASMGVNGFAASMNAFEMSQVATMSAFLPGMRK